MTALTRSAVLAAIGGVFLVAVATGGAAQKTGCPVGTGWEQLTIDEVGDAVFPNLIPGYPWQTQEEFEAFAREQYDRNGDDRMCLKTHAGDDLNPKSHWWRVGIDLGFGTGVSFYQPRDNNSGASSA